MKNPYSAKILRVDLDSQKTSFEEIPEQDIRWFIGGSGLGARYLWRETTAATGPFSPENRLAFMVGPFTACTPMSGRYSVCAISPASGAWGEANGGGKWPAELKRAGLSGIVVQGKARTSVYLYVDDGRVEIRDAKHLWGKDTYEVSDLIKGETSDKASVAAIGRAGENLVTMASIVNDGRMGRVAARCGMGAVMGSKNLKAIAVRGTGKPMTVDGAGLKQANLEINRKLNQIKAGPTALLMSLKNITLASYGRGVVSPRNASRAHFDSFFKKFETDFEDGEKQYCANCPIGCLESHSIEGRRQVVGQALTPIGAGCLIDDFKALQEAYDLCNLYGMDTQSVGFCLSFAMECFEEGLITKKDTGLDLTWGNAQAAVEMIRQMGEARGFGRLLGQGVRRAAEQIGGKAHLYAMHVKGLEPASQDPRGDSCLLLGYATANPGAHHMESRIVHVAVKRTPREGPFFDGAELGFPPPIERMCLEGKAKMVAKIQDFAGIANSLLTCFYSSGIYGLPIHTHLEVFNRITGYDMTFDEFMECGERIFNQKRLINLRRGLTSADDTLPPHYFTRRPDIDASLEYVPSREAFNKAVQEYYAARGWGSDGVPTREKLDELGLVA